MFMVSLRCAHFFEAVFLVLLGGLLNVCAQAQPGAASPIHADCHNLCF